MYEYNVYSVSNIEILVYWNVHEFCIPQFPSRLNRLLILNYTVHVYHIYIFNCLRIAHIYVGLSIAISILMTVNLYAMCVLPYFLPAPHQILSTAQQSERMFP